MSPEAVCFTGAVRDVDPAYAIIRVDLDVEDDEARFTVRRIVWSEEFGGGRSSTTPRAERRQGRPIPLAVHTRRSPFVGLGPGGRLADCASVQECHPTVDSG
jgi:hypothetical protein